MNLAWRTMVRYISTILAWLACGTALVCAQDYVRYSGPEVFSYDELVHLGSDQTLSPDLQTKLQTLTTTPFISNEAYFRGAQPRPLNIPALGPSLRVAFWNIERGLELDDIQLFLTDKHAFMTKMAEERKHATESGKRMRRRVHLELIPDEIEVLKAADVWILNEVDWGVKRTQYRHVVRELAETLNMNWAFGVEFLEVSPVQLGVENFQEVVDDEAVRQQLVHEFQVDKDQLKALHGNAVLSRYPIRSARLVPFTVGYDWFKESKIRPLEAAKRKAAVVIGEDLAREVRRGQRTTLYVDLDVPDAPGHSVTIAATHLENRTQPKTRRKQLEELMNQVRAVNHPVIVAGDLNTTGGNSTPTSIENALYKRYGSLDFWTTKGVQWATGIGFIYSAGKLARSLSGIQYRVDPTSANIPGASPNLERGLFASLERFRFDDGTAFDFRGIPERTVNNRAGTLADSNERSSKGFAPSFVTELIWGKVQVAKFKLDWIFVKSNLASPRDENGSYLFAPHFARTMTSLNNAPPEPISDHSPMTVDLPFHEPPTLPIKAKQ